MAALRTKSVLAILELPAALRAELGPAHLHSVRRTIKLDVYLWRRNDCYLGWRTVGRCSCWLPLLADEPGLPRVSTTSSGYPGSDSGPDSAAERTYCRLGLGADLEFSNLLTTRSRFRPKAIIETSIKPVRPVDEAWLALG